LYRHKSSGFFRLAVDNVFDKVLFGGGLKTNTIFIYKI
jgi:hypothetical protein